MIHPDEIEYLPEDPQPLLRKISPGAPYPAHALGPLRAVVETAQSVTLAPMAIAGQSALAVASLAVQGFADVETLGGNRPTSLYLLTVARSGERKSSCDALLMKTLREFEREQSKIQRGEVTRWQNKHSLWKVERERILVDAKKAKERTVTEVDLAALGAEPAAPPVPDRTVSEPTFEGLTRKFMEGMPTLGIFSDEGGQFLGGFAMNSDNRQKTLAALNDLWQGNPIRRTRAGEGSLTLFGRRLAIHLMVQPEVARAFLADPAATDTGFLPRFLICEPESTIGTRLHALAKSDGPALEAFSQRLSSILDAPVPMDPDTRELTPRLLPLSLDARKLLIAFSDKIETAQAKGGDLCNLTGFASKIAEQAARIAGVLTLFADLDAPEVTAAAMADAITLAQFYLSEAKRLSEAATFTAEIERAERFRVWLLENWAHNEILPAEVLQHAPIRALRESPGAKAALALLEKHGWVTPLPKGTHVRGAARKLAYRIVRPRYVV